MDDISVILPKDALAGKLLAVSVSSSPDLGRLGLMDSHLRLVLGEVTRMVILAGGQLGYGGHLEPSGYTAFLVSELYRYSRRDEPVKLFLSWDTHRVMDQEDLKDTIREYALHAEVILLDRDGEQIGLEQRGRLLQSGQTDHDAQAALTAMRRFAVSRSDGQFLIGGARADYKGRFPGVIEEAIFALNSGHPIYPAAGYGGATFDVAKVVYGDLLDLDMPDITAGKGLVDALEALRQTLKEKGVPSTGLRPAEMKRLLCSYRPSEIASLVGCGLGRLASRLS
ncbi:MAG: hypothetical protein V7741_00220 [Hyphomonas sp.]